MYAWCVYVCILGLNVKCFLCGSRSKSFWNLLLSVIQQRNAGITLTFSFLWDIFPFHAFHCCLHSNLPRFSGIYCHNLLNWSLSPVVPFSHSSSLTCWSHPSDMHDLAPAHLTSSISFYYFSYSSSISHTERIPVLWILFLPSVPKLTLLPARNAFAFFLSLIAVHLILTLSSKPLLLTNSPLSLSLVSLLFFCSKITSSTSSNVLKWI